MRASSPCRVDYLLNALKQAKTPANTAKPVKGPRLAKFGADTVTLASVITASRLTSQFSDRPPLSDVQVTRSQTFWNKAHPRLEWTVGSYADLPDVKWAAAQAKEEAAIEAEKDSGVANPHRKRLRAPPPKLLAPLPEVLVVGHTNAGKSSLMNALVASPGLAYVAKRPGFTQTLNCYNVGDKLRVLDSSGYGAGGHGGQGKLVLDYVAERQRLQRVYVVVDSEEGVCDHDHDLVGHLAASGVSCDLVFTKVDRVVQKAFNREARRLKDQRLTKEELAEATENANAGVVSYYTRVLEESGVLALPSSPQVFFVNSYTNNYVGRRNGVPAIRADMMLACGLL
ncbi:MIOREX complex component 8 [Diutina catenulata]